jgi:hypothetical protein
VDVRVVEALDDALELLVPQPHVPPRQAVLDLAEGAGVLLEHHHLQPRVGQHPRQLRASDRAADDRDGLGGFGGAFGRHGRRIGRDQALGPVADQVLAAGLEQRLAHDEPVLGLEELHQRALHFAVLELLHRLDRLHRHRIEAGVVHARRDVHRAGMKSCTWRGR